MATKASSIVADAAGACARSSAGLLVPSAVLRREKNLLINPAHADFGKIRLNEVEEDGLDRRLFG